MKIIGIIVLIIGYIIYLKFKNAMCRKHYIKHCIKTNQPIDDRLEF